MADPVAGERRWKDGETEGVLHAGRLSIYGKPSMTASDGTVAVGIEAPWVEELLSRLRAAEEALSTVLRFIETGDRESHQQAGAACGVDACSLCLAESVAREALASLEQKEER